MTSADVRVHADLTVTVDGHAVAITADGQHVRVDVSDPQAVIDAITSAALPVGTPFPSTLRSVPRGADLLDATGLTVTIVGPAGRLATLGAGVGGSRWSGRLLGSRHLSIGRPSSWGVAVRPVLKAVLRRVRATVIRRVSRAH